MKIKVPTEEESKRETRAKRLHFLGGFITGIIFFGLIGSRVFWYGFDKVELYTWILLSLGVISFGFLAMWFRAEFWQTLFRNK